MEFITFLVSIFALVMVMGARTRIQLLEAQVRALLQQQKNTAAQPVSVTQAVPSQTQVSQSVPTPLQQAAPQIPSQKPFSLAEWFKEDWLLKIGALLLLIGFGWFATYAIANNWIGPAGRITLGLLVGAGIMVLGFWRMQRVPQQGDIFLALGAGIVLLITFAARALYGFFDPLSSLGLMFITSAFVAAASVIYNRRQLAVVSVLIAGIAPFLTNSESSDYVGLFTYYAVVLAGSLWITAFKGYREVASAALAVLVVYSMPILGGATTDTTRDTLFIFECAFALAIFVAHTMGITKTEGMSRADMFTAGVNATLLLFWIMAVIPKEMQSLVVALCALIFAVGSYLAFTMTERREPFYLYAGMGLVYLGVATALELEGNALVIAYTIEASIMTVVAFLLTKDIAAARKTSVLFFVPVLLSLPTLFDTFNGVTFSMMLLMAVSLAGTGLFFRELALATSSEQNRQWYATLVIVGSLYMLLILWRFCTEILFPYQSFGVMCVLVLYTIIAIGAYVIGTRLDIKAYRMYGACLIAFVLGRLFLVEVWQMEMVARIICFITIGTLMMATAFMMRKK